MSENQRSARGRRMVGAIAISGVLLVAGAVPAAAAGGIPGPCREGTPLAGETLGGDVSFVARHGFTPLPQHFAFPDGEPMPPGQILQFARANGLC